MEKDRIFYEDKILPIIKKDSLEFHDGYESSCCTVTIPKPTLSQITKINKLIFSLRMEKIGFIRDPVERLYSAWCHRVISGYSIPEKRINTKTFFQILDLKRKHNFLEFVQSLNNLKSGTLNYELFFNNIHFKKYHDVHSKIFIDKFLPIEFLEEMRIGIYRK